RPLEDGRPPLLGALDVAADGFPHRVDVALLPHPVLAFLHRPAISSGACEATRVRISRVTAGVALAAAALSVLVRLPFFGAPLTADEGGYAEVARLWGRGATLYRDIWVDRPQGLVLIFRGVLQIGSSTETIRAAAAFVGALSVVATMVLAYRLGGRRAALAGGLLMATFGASPFLESFTLAGELLGSLAAILSLLAFAAWLRGRNVWWLPAAGVLSGCAVMVKQSAFDAALAIVVYLAWTERRRAGR